jgi:hypothetical protein
VKIKDPLKAYRELREAIENERVALYERLKEIDGQLSEMGLRASDGYYGPRTPTGRVRNAMSLKEAVLKVLEAGPMTKDEVFDSVGALGYQFSTEDPLNSLGVVLYGRDPKFQRVGGKFALPK